jgi:Family of unknown function (DUF6221)
MTLSEFLAARLDEDEATAEAVRQVSATDWRHEKAVTADGPVTAVTVPLRDDLVLVTTWRDDAVLAPWIARWDPARVLREVDAKRKILARYGFACRQAEVTKLNAVRQHVGDAEHEAWSKIAGALERDVVDLAAVWSGHPDYDPAWA